MTHYSSKAACAVVIANMIGTGVFTSLGFQLLEIQSPLVIILLWVVGGITALCGALSYAELAAALPRSGGEYHFLTQIYHPCVGFISGWVSATVGFAAPTALAALTFGNYLLATGIDVDPSILATIIILLLTLSHSTNHRSSGAAQVLLTLLKIILILGFCITVFFFGELQINLEFSWNDNSRELLGSSAFAVSLIYVNYAYSGWNAATYISEELESPQKSLPVILFGSTAFVTILYCLLNFTFLYAAPVESLVGRIEIGLIAAKYSLGEAFGWLMGLLLALLLISTMSAMILAGPRVLQRIGQDYPLFKFFAKENADGIPIIAILTLSGTALIFLWTASFEQILVLSGATMALNTFATVLGLFVLRLKRPDLDRPFQVTFYPITPLIFLSITGWTLGYLVFQKPSEALVSLIIVATGALIFFFSPLKTRAVE